VEAEGPAVGGMLQAQIGAGEEQPSGADQLGKSAIQRTLSIGRVAQTG
jgi:hypothetical protein